MLSVWNKIGAHDTNGPMSNPPRRWMRWAVRSIGFVIFAYLLHRIGPEKIWNTILSVHLGYFAAALPIFFLMIGVKSIKTQILLKTPVSLRDLYRLNAFGFSVGSITPGRLGEFTKVIFLSNHHVPVAEAFSATLIDRLSDVILMMICAVAGVCVFFSPAAGWAAVAALAGLVVAALALWFSDKLLRRVTTGRLRDLIDIEGHAIRSFIQTVPVRVWLSVSALTVAYLGLYFLQMWILARGLHLPISYVQTTMAISAAAVPAILPISVFNVGPRDAVLASIFRNMGWGGDKGVALSTLILVLFLMNGVFGLFFLPRRKQA